MDNQPASLKAPSPPSVMQPIIAEGLGMVENLKDKLEFLRNERTKLDGAITQIEQDLTKLANPIKAIETSERYGVRS